MNQTIRYDKGRGNAAIYALIPQNGQFWDFAAKAWVGAETAACRAFMAEFGDTSESQSWYHCSFDIPGHGPYTIEIRDTAQLDPIGYDFAVDGEVLVGPGAVTCAQVISFVSRQLQDMTNVVWPAAVLLTYLNYAVREIVDLKPEANTVLGLVTMVAGTRQTIPDGWNILINAKRNMGSNGTTPGRAITQLPRLLLDSALPDWNTWPTAAEVRHIATDDRDPLHFDVFPPQPANTAQKIEAIGSKYPTKATDPVYDGFPLPDQYEVPAADYMIYRALYESTAIPNALAKAGTSLSKFYQGLGVKKQVEVKTKAEGQ